MQELKTIQVKEIDFEDWLNSPLTKALKETIQEYRDSAFEAVTQEVANKESLKDVDMYKVAELRGNLQTFNTLIDLRDFLSFKVTTEVKHEEDQTQSQS